MTIDWDAPPSKAGWYARTHDNGQKAECYWDGQVWQPTYKRVVQRFPQPRPLYIPPPPIQPSPVNTAPVNNEPPPMNLPLVEDAQQPPQEEEPPQKAWTIRAAIWRHKLITVLAAGVLLVAGIVTVLAVSGGVSGHNASYNIGYTDGEQIGTLVPPYSNDGTQEGASQGYCQTAEVNGMAGNQNTNGVTNNTDFSNGWFAGCVAGFLSQGH